MLSAIHDTHSPPAGSIPAKKKPSRRNARAAHGLDGVPLCGFLAVKQEMDSDVLGLPSPNFIFKI